MKKFTLLLSVFFAICVCWQNAAQITVGDGTYSSAFNTYPINAYYGYSYAQSIYLASEINASGDITSISFEMEDEDAIPNSDDMIDLWIGHTSLTEFSSTTDWVDVSTLTQVMTSGTLTKVGTTITFTFSSPFTYNGTDNIIIALDANEGGFDTSADKLIGTNVAVNRTLRQQSDSTNSDPLSPETGTLTPYVGNITFYGIAQSCPQPTVDAVSDLTTTSVTLNWTAGGAEMDWEIEVINLTLGETLTGVATHTANTNSLALSSLDSSSEYGFALRADCGASEYSSWTDMQSFFTLCTPITAFPWSEDFESVSTPDIPNCWSIMNNNSDSDEFITYSGYGVGGSTAAGLYTDFNSGNNDDYLILPQMTLTGNERLRFSVRSRSVGEPNDYRVVLSTTGNAAVDFSTELMALTQVASTTQTEISPINLSAYSGDVYIAIHVPSGGLDGYYIYFDEFVIDEIPNCIEPVLGNVSNLTATTADIDWSQGDAETEWEYVVQADGTGEPAGSGTLVSTSSVTEPGLVEGSDYEFYVRAKCGPSEFSTWVGPISWFQIAAPDNDDCNNAISLTVNADLDCTDVTSGSTEGATASAQLELDGAISGTPNTDVWFSFVATSTLHNISLDNVTNLGGGTSTSLDMGMAVYDASIDCDNLVLVDDSDPNAFDVSGLTIGTTYLVRVYGWGSTIQYNSFDICVGTPAAPPANDNCADAELLIASTDSSCDNMMSGTTESASTSADDGCSTTGRDVWYSFTPAQTGNYIFEISETFQSGSASTYVALYSGSCGSLTQVNSSCFDTDGFTENLTAGETYLVNVRSSSSTYYVEFDLCVYTEPTCFSISGITAVSNTPETATLTWSAPTNGNAPSSYNWEVVPSGNDQGDGVIDFGNVLTESADVTGLEGSTTYDVYMQSDCGSSDFSGWGGPFSFTTACNVVSDFPAITDMSSNVPDSCWEEANGGDLVGGFSTSGASDWRAPRAYENSIGESVSSNAINLWQSNDIDWLLSPVYDLSGGDTYELTIEVAVTNYSSSGTATTTADTMGSDDEVYLVVSDDSGVTWTTLTTWNAGNQPSVNGTEYIADLSLYSGNVQFAVVGYEGTSDDSEDYDFHVGKFEVEAASTLGINPNETEEFTYFPNPVTSQLTLKGQSNLNKVSIYNVVGQEVLTMEPNNVEAVMDLSSLTSGAYFVKVEINNQIETIRVIKQ